MVVSPEADSKEEEGRNRCVLEIRYMETEWSRQVFTWKSDAEGFIQQMDRTGQYNDDKSFGKQVLLK